VVKEMIESHIHQLRADLQNLGLEIDELDVFVADDRERRKGFTGHAKSSQTSRRSAKTDAVDSTANLENGPTSGNRSGLDESGIDFFV
jgi:flagellar hook-length control protein FliK